MDWSANAGEIKAATKINPQTPITVLLIIENQPDQVITRTGDPHNLILSINNCILAGGIHCQANFLNNYISLFQISIDDQGILPWI